MVGCRHEDTCLCTGQPSPLEEQTLSTTTMSRPSLCSRFQVVVCPALRPKRVCVILGPLGVTLRCKSCRAFAEEGVAGYMAALFRVGGLDGLLGPKVSKDGLVAPRQNYMCMQADTPGSLTDHQQLPVCERHGAQMVGHHTT